MWATSVPILVFLGLSVLELRPMYATDRRQTEASLNASALWGGGWRHDKKVITVATQTHGASPFVSQHFCTGWMCGQPNKHVFFSSNV